MTEVKPPSEFQIIAVKNLKMYFPITRGVFRRRVGDIKAIDSGLRLVAISNDRNLNIAYSSKRELALEKTVVRPPVGPRKNRR